MSFSSEAVKTLARQTGHVIVCVPDMNDIRTLEPKDRKTLIKWLKDAPRPDKHS